MQKFLKRAVWPFDFIAASTISARKKRARGRALLTLAATQIGRIHDSGSGNFVGLCHAKALSRHHATIRCELATRRWSIECHSKNGMLVDQSAATSVAVIVASDDKKKYTVVCQGASQHVGDEEVHAALETLVAQGGPAGGRVLLMHAVHKTSSDAMIAVARGAREQGYLVVFKAAPIPAHLEAAKLLLASGFVEGPPPRTPMDGDSFRDSSCIRDT